MLAVRGMLGQNPEDLGIIVEHRNPPLLDGFLLTGPRVGPHQPFASRTIMRPSSHTGPGRSSGSMGRLKPSRSTKYSKVDAPVGIEAAVARWQ
jgi:hypothetical protein